MSVLFTVMETIGVLSFGLKMIEACWRYRFVALSILAEVQGHYKDKMFLPKMVKALYGQWNKFSWWARNVLTCPWLFVRIFL